MSVRKHGSVPWNVCLMADVLGHQGIPLRWNEREAVVAVDRLRWVGPYLLMSPNDDHQLMPSDEPSFDPLRSNEAWVEIRGGCFRH